MKKAFNLESPTLQNCHLYLREGLKPFLDKQDLATFAITKSALQEVLQG